jgi:PIN domain nuclease of toxin-antitoxin system
VTHLDTHVAIFVSVRNDRRTRALRPRLESDEIVLSPIALLEMQFLYELGRLTETAEQIFDDLADRFEVRLAETPLQELAQDAMTHSWTRDPIDRLIVANATVDGADLLTFDEVIHDHFDRAVWK